MARLLALQESPGLLDVFRSRRMAVLFVFGFSSGLPLFLTGQTLQAWLSDAGCDLPQIAAVSSIGIAYSLKFAWAPLLDRFRLPWLGRRRGWILALQIALALAIAAMSMFDPISTPGPLFMLGGVVALLSASQDVVLDGYNADTLEPHERAAGTAIYVLGYRIALVVTGTFALVVAGMISWRAIYLIVAALLSIGIAGTLYADEPRGAERPPLTLQRALVLPFVAFVRKLGGRGAALILAFAAVYLFGYYFSQALIIKFLTDTGFSLREIGAINKALGLASTAVGGLAAGGLVARFGLRRTLVVFGALAAGTHLLYVWLALVGHDVPILCAAVVLDNAANAMGVTAFLAVLMSACSPAVSATQFAVLTSLSSVGQRVFGRFTADVVHAVGYAGFFATTALMAIPGLVLAWYVAREVRTDA